MAKAKKTKKAKTDGTTANLGFEATLCSMFARNAGPAVVAPPTNRRSVHDR